MNIGEGAGNSRNLNYYKSELGSHFSIPECFALPYTDTNYCGAEPSQPPLVSDGLGGQNIEVFF